MSKKVPLDYNQGEHDDRWETESAARFQIG